jgi:hypothetical protein
MPREWVLVIWTITPRRSKRRLERWCQPSARAFDHPALAPEPVIALDVATGCAVLDATTLEVVRATRKVAALVGVHPSKFPGGDIRGHLRDEDRQTP